MTKTRELQKLKEEGLKLSERLAHETDELEKFRSGVGKRVLDGEDHDEIVGELERRERELEVVRISLEHTNEMVTKAQEEQAKKDLEKRRREGEKLQRVERELTTDTLKLLVQVLENLDELVQLRGTLRGYKLSGTFEFSHELRHLVNFVVNRAKNLPGMVKFAK